MGGLFGGDSDPAAALPLARRIEGVRDSQRRAAQYVGLEPRIGRDPQRQDANRPTDWRKHAWSCAKAEAGDRRVRRLSFLTARAAKMMHKAPRIASAANDRSVAAYPEPGEREKLLANGLNALLRAYACKAARQRCGSRLQTPITIIQTDHLHCWPTPNRQPTSTTGSPTGNAMKTLASIFLVMLAVAAAGYYYIHRYGGDAASSFFARRP